MLAEREGEQESVILAPCMVWASPEAHMVKKLLAMQETWVWSLGQDDPLETV